jgi:hypothetical protein
MHISGEGKIGIGLGLLGLLGVGIPMVAPQYPWLGWPFIATSVLGLIALAFHHFRVRSRFGLPDRTRTASALIALLGGVCLISLAIWKFWINPDTVAHHDTPPDWTRYIGYEDIEKLRTNCYDPLHIPLMVATNGSPTSEDFVSTLSKAIPIEKIGLTSKLEYTGVGFVVWDKNGPSYAEVKWARCFMASGIAVKILTPDPAHLSATKFDLYVGIPGLTAR